MKCQKCGSNEATTHITTIVNGIKNESYLCPYCAGQNNETSLYKSVFSNDFENFLGGLLHSPAFSNKETNTASGTCPQCGSTLKDITKHGKLGCGQCYKRFKDYLLRPMKEIHGSNTHTGKVPKRSGAGLKLEDEISHLKDELNRAVLDQNFEKAATLRDKIKELEGKRG